MKKFHRNTLLPVAALATLFLALALPLEAQAQAQFEIPGPEGSGNFGTEIVALPNGNIVVTDPFYSIPGGPENVGAVYLYNGATEELISMLTGSTANDYVGMPWYAEYTGGTLEPGIRVLANGNFVVRSQSWSNGPVADVGAVTFINGETGLSGVISASNSLVGSTTGDRIGQGITALSNGNYVVASSAWDNGGIENVGAATFANGTTGITGEISVSNSLIGGARNDFVSNRGVTALTNGNYVVRSESWDNGGTGTDKGKGAATFGDGSSGVTGVVSAANSLVGATAEDSVGRWPVVPLSNGNYVVSSPDWTHNGVEGAGAATFGNGETGVSGEISASNSLVGERLFDSVGARITALTNGNYVVGSRSWSSESVSAAGAATFGSGTVGVTGLVSASNSLVGSTPGDRIGDSITALANGNYVVGSPEWDNEGIRDTGAATFGDGATGITGVVSASNSLVGSTANDRVGRSEDIFSTITALSNGNYVVTSPDWDNGGTANAGAATLGDGTAGITGPVSASNSLVGSSADDRVGSFTTALTNGNYVVSSKDWDRGTVANAGAVTFANGTTGITGEVSISNSLVGSSANDSVGGAEYMFDNALITPLLNGNYVVRSPEWDNGAVENAGAVTFGDGTTGITGEVSSANSLVGSTAHDQVGFARDSQGGIFGFTVTALSNGDYVVLSRQWDNGAIADAGAVTYGDGNSGTVGPVTADNSVLGTVANRGDGIVFDFDAVNNKLAVGRPFENVVTLFEVPSGSLLNISTRMKVETGENVLIGGFIVTGSEAKRVILRAIGPSLGAQGVSDTLPDPTLELFDGAGGSVAFNDDWKDTQQAEIEGSTIPPSRDEEAAIVANLQPGNYTAVVRGNGDSTGIGLVEVYDLAQATASTLANISSRGRVETGEDVMIGGFIVGGGTRVVVRAIGPSLTGAGVADALQDPTLQLVDANGTEIRANDNWKSDQQAEIEAIGIQPTDDREAALVANLGAGNYTAVVRGAANGTGVGLVEVYNLQ